MQNETKDEKNGNFISNDEITNKRREFLKNFSKIIAGVAGFSIINCAFPRKGNSTFYWNYVQNEVFHHYGIIFHQWNIC